MNKLVYVGGVIVVIIILALVFVGLKGTSPSSPANNGATTQQATTAPASVQSTLNTTTVPYPTTTISNATTAPTQGNTTLIYNNTPTGKNCANLTGYQCASVQCTSVNSSFTCTGASFGYSKNMSELSLSVGQNTGSDWSGFGVAFVPTGTAMDEGVPQGVTFYVADNSSSNVGTSLQNGQSTFVQFGQQALGGYGTTLRNGSIWVCYINSGTLYVANGCTSSGGSPAQYAEVGTV